MDQFAANLRTRAVELGLTSAEISRKLEISERRYGHYVRGDREPDLATLVRIARSLESSPNALLGFDIPSEIDPLQRLRDRMAIAVSGMNERDLELIVVQIEAAAKFVRNRAS